MAKDLTESEPEPHIREMFEKPAKEAKQPPKSPSKSTVSSSEASSSSSTSSRHSPPKKIAMHASSPDEKNGGPKNLG